MEVPFLLAVYTLLCALTVIRATNTVSLQEIEKYPEPHTIDLGTYIMHYCHYHCIAYYHCKPASYQCASCMEACIGKMKDIYPSYAPQYDALVESAQEKNIMCASCHGFDDDHMALTTWVMCTFPYRHARNLVSPDGIDECKNKLLQKFTTSPYPQTVDVGTYVMHYCHHDCIVRFDHIPKSVECTSCIETCIGKMKKSYYHIAGYDASVESAREKNIGCLKCHDVHREDMYLTTWVMCNFPHRLENKFSATPEGVEKCREILMEEYTDPIVNAGAYVTHLCHYRCIFEEKKEPKTSDCVKCIRDCRQKIMATLSQAPNEQKAGAYRHAYNNDGNQMCTTCEEFDDLHMEETAMDICRYPHDDPKLSKDSRECYDSMIKAYNKRKKERKHVKRGVGEVMRVIY